MAHDLIEVTDNEIREKTFSIIKGKGCIIKVFMNVPDITGKVYLLEMPLADCFFKDGSILVPGKLLSETEVAHSTPLYISTLLGFLESTSAKNCLFAVHDSDQERAASRAENLKAFLTDSVTWAKLGVKNCQTQDKQLILKWINTIRNWNCDPGKVDNLAWGKYNTAVDNYQEHHGHDYGLWPTTSEMYWKTWHEMIYRTIADLMDEESVGMPASMMNFLDPYFIACGEEWGVAKVKANDYSGVFNGRIDMLFFEDADIPTAETTENALRGIYGNPKYQSIMILPKGCVPHVLGAVVVDKEDNPITNMDYTVKFNGTAVRTGKAGTIKHPLPEGTYQILVTDPDFVPVQENASAEDTNSAEDDYWEGGESDLQALLNGEYQRKGAYKDDMSGFKNENLNRFLKSACGFAGCSPTEVEESSGSDATETGDSEQGRYVGMPVWLRFFQQKAATSTTWGQKEQMYSRLMGAFYYAYFVEKIYKDKNIVMPANVEMFLEHLGKSSINKAATSAEVGGTCDTDNKAYCASCSSFMFRNSLNRYGYNTGFMGWSKDAGCPVDYQQGIHSGDEYAPKPGDILSVRTATGPLSGHVVTVVYAETDGTHGGRIWYVSGNASNKSVSCDHLNVDPTSDRPPRGSIAVINRCFNSDMQPHTLEGKSPDELNELKLERLEGDFPAPNKAGVVPAQEREQESPAKDDEAQLSASGALVASGEVATQPDSGSLELVPLKIELKILDFQVKLADAADDTYTDDLLIEPGKKLCFKWMAQNFKTLYLEPAALDLTQQTRQGTVTVEIDPSSCPPVDGGEYKLIASNGEAQVEKIVKVKGIIDFWIEAGERRYDTNKPPELLARVMNGLKYGTPNYNSAGKISAMPGLFNTLMEGDDYEHWWWGQISIKTDAKLFWQVVGPEGMSITLRINRVVGKNTPSDSFDVSGENFSKNVRGVIQGQYYWEHHGKYMTFFETDLQLFDDSSMSSEISNATIRLRENYEMPGIEEFDIFHGNGFSEQVGMNGFARFQGGESLKIKYKLKGGHSHSGLRFVIYNKEGLLCFEEEVYSYVKQGEYPTEIHKKDEYTYTLKQTLPKDRYFSGKAYLEIFNSKGMVDRKG